MNNKYSICWLQICPFDRLGNGILRPDRNNFPYRLCVLDKNRKKAVDVKREEEYDYIRTSTVYFLNEEAKKIEEGKRYAIMELNIASLGVENEDYSHAIKIKEMLEQCYVFKTGNMASNEEYLADIIEEQKKKLKLKKK